MASSLAAQVQDALPSSPSSAAAAWRLVFVSHSDLPQSLQFLPTLFRLFAIALFVPVAALAVVDIVGWVAFKLVLRPLGYASTRHFKDPEKDARLIAVPLHGSMHSPASTCEGVLPSSGESTSSGASDIFPSPAFSDTTPLPPIEEHDVIRAGRPPKLAAIFSSAASSSPSSSSPSSTSSSGTSSPRHNTHMRLRLSTSNSRGTAHIPPRGSPTASPSESGDESSTVRQMQRARAQSVGFDGPLFGEGDETDTGTTTPGAESDAESLSSATTEKEQLPGDYLSHKPARGDGVPRGGFKLGLTEVQRRPSVAGGA